MCSEEEGEEGREWECRRKIERGGYWKNRRREDEVEERKMREECETRKRTRKGGNRKKEEENGERGR